MKKKMAKAGKLLNTRDARKLLNTPARRREAMDLVKFIDAHGGRLGAFRGYGAAQRTSPPPVAPSA